jgi:hypothetical protein
MAVIFYSDPIMDKGTVPEEYKGVVERWKLKYGEWQIDLLDWGTLEKPYFVIEDDDGFAPIKLGGIWKGNFNALTRLIDFAPEEYRDLKEAFKNGDIQGIKNILLFWLDSTKEVEVEKNDEGKVETVSFPIVFKVDEETGELKEFVLADEYADNFRKRIEKEVGVFQDSP